VGILWFATDGGDYDVSVSRIILEAPRRQCFAGLGFLFFGTSGHSVDGVPACGINAIILIGIAVVVSHIRGLCGGMAPHAHKT